MSTYAEIQEQIAALQQQASTLLATERAQGIAEIRALMDANGITLEDLQTTAPRTRKSSGTVAAKYYDADSGKSWTGRGRAPTWLAGKNKEDYLIAR